MYLTIKLLRNNEIIDRRKECFRGGFEANINKFCKTINEIINLTKVLGEYAYETEYRLEFEIYAGFNCKKEIDKYVYISTTFAKGDIETFVSNGYVSMFVEGVYVSEYDLHI